MTVNGLEWLFRVTWLHVKFIRCVRNKSAGSLDVGVGRDGRRCIGHYGDRK